MIPAVPHHPGGDASRRRGIRPLTLMALMLIVLIFIPPGFNADARFGPSSSVAASQKRSYPRHLYPKLFIQVQKYYPSATLLDKAADWDVLVLDAETVASRPEFLGPSGRIRSHSAAAVVLFYFSPADIIPGNPAPINAGFLAGLKDGDYMKDAAGARYLLFLLPGGVWTEMLNLTTRVNGYLPAYLKSAVVSKGLGDGVFYDWITEQISWLNDRSPNPNKPLDIDNDGVADSDAKLDSAWVRGTKNMLAKSRQKYPEGTLIVGNGGWVFDDTYKGCLQGRMVENFLGGESFGYDWHRVLRGHWLMHRGSLSPKISLIMANGGMRNYRFMRFALCSTLMFDGYFAYTNTGTYQASWWYDEYSVDKTTGKAVRSLAFKGWLGSPKGAAYDAADTTVLLSSFLLKDDRSSLTKVWRRDFEYGTALVNPGSATRTVSLGAVFRKIKGTFDPATNDGKTVSSVQLEPRSGLVLLAK